MRVPRTFCFVDLSGFTNYTAEHGDDAAGEVLSAFRAIVRQVASERGVRIAKWLGDGCMIVSVSQEAAVAAMLELEACTRDACRPLALRVGIATGFALLFEGDDYIGAAVNLAARLCDAADPYEVLMPADHVRELPPGAEAVAHGCLVLRGFPEPIDTVALSGRAPTGSAHDTGELWTRSPFVA